MDILTQLDIMTKTPRSWLVTSYYADGSTRVHATHCKAGAENFAIGERRKIGKRLIDRATGNSVQIVRVEISKV